MVQQALAEIIVVLEPLVEPFLLEDHTLVNAGDLVAIKSVPSQVASMDPDGWSTLSVQWIGQE